MIEGTRLRLWPLERHDLLKNYQWANDPELIRLAGINPLPKSVWEIERWYESVATNPEVHMFAIKTPEGEYVGNIELRDLDVRCGRAEMGVLIGDRAFWGKGYGTDAIRALCLFAFHELRLHRLYARILESNPRALRAFEKCGFQAEGVERECHFSEGRFLDVHVLGILERDLPGKTPDKTPA